MWMWGGGGGGGRIKCKQRIQGARNLIKSGQTPSSPRAPPSGWGGGGGGGGGLNVKLTGA